MLNLLEIAGSYDDSWRLTFYFILALVILLGLIWTVLQIYKKDKKNNKTNVIYDKPYDAIEDNNNNSKKNKNVNYYDVYQTSKKTSKIKRTDNE
ncbi:MAG: hypothetical protein IKN63_05100 [Bacilli bacterium]|nr:hypothetical protein [Bacilli bacterium]